MTDDLTTLAERRFAERRVATGARDPREFYRGLLRDLRGANEASYREMVARYESRVVAAVARGEADPLEAWLAFGLELAEASAGTGRAVVVDATGRATPLEGRPRWDQMILHLPEGKGARGVPVSLPPELSDAQRATLDLLVKGKVRTSTDD
jgi:hypothetical protein